jgi:AAA15 family ATPase/GTPase
MNSCQKIARDAVCICAPAVMLFFSLLFAGCGSDPDPEAQDIAIQVNNRKISLAEFNEQLKFEVYADPEIDLTQDSRAAFIDYLIQKELMIQEAVRLDLDRKEEFVRTIQTYWESTLIRQLMDLKTEEFKKKILVTENEIDDYYEENKDWFDGVPTAEVREQIARKLTSRKLSARMEEWIDSLRQNAEIIVDPQLISQP